MIICKKCRSDVVYNGTLCPVCQTPLVIDDADIKRAKAELDEAKLDTKNPDRYFSLCHLLADGGDTDGQRELAKLLEKQDPINNLDRAMDYYKLAADVSDPYSTYRYSCLVGRIDARASSFFLRYSAVLGCKEAYPAVSEHYSVLGNEELAAYYCFLAAECDDTVSVVNMAKRYNDGIGVPQSPECAKFYIDKMTIPPISALKLAVKLRGVKSEVPKKPQFPDYASFINNLAKEALALECMNAYFKLTVILSDLGNINALCTLGILYAEGRGTERSLNRAKHYLDLAANKGNAIAAFYLAEEYASGAVFPKSIDTALAYYHRAAAMGYTAAYEKVGELYYAGDGVEKDVKLSVQYFERAGTESATARALDIKSKRYSFYKRGCEIMLKQTPSDSEREEAFRAFAIATAMGEPNSEAMLAECYARGFGTKKDRPSAFFWYDRAYAEGDMNALMPLALCYSRGIGTAFNYKTAIRLLSLASSKNMKGADDELIVLQERRAKKLVRSLYSLSMSLIYEKKCAEAVKVLSSMAGFGYPKALYTLGCLYEFGAGISVSDKTRANEYYELAIRGSQKYGSFTDPASAYKLKILKLIR